MPSKRKLLGLLAALLILPTMVAADTITFTSTNSYDSAWYWAGPGQPLWGSILSGTATQGSSGTTVGISCGYNCWISWGTGNGNPTGNGSVAFASAGSYIWIYGNDGNGSATIFLSGTFSNTMLTPTGQNDTTLTAQFSGTLSPVLLALFGLSANGPVSVSGTYTAILLGSFDPNTGGFGWHDPNNPNSWGTGVLQVTVADGFDTREPVPEPGTLALFGTGLLALARAARRKLKI